MGFLPTTAEELHSRGIDQLDVILVSGDSYIDSPYIGVAVVGRVLEAAGYSVGVIAQPATGDLNDITRLGEPRLFWGVTGGSVDSLVANYTASRRRRKRDDYTPGGVNDRRPDRAVLAYTNLIRRAFKGTVPIVLGGIEASLRRLTHFDFWSNRLRRSILLDAKADYLLYGMADRSVCELANRLDQGEDPRDMRGLCWLAGEVPENSEILPSFEACAEDPAVFTAMFHTFYANQDALTARPLAQQHGQRWVVQNPPALPPTQAELDQVYDLPYERAQHPYYEAQGAVRALETIRFAINTHHGCYGECNFCSIAVHEGRTVSWRSVASIRHEAEVIARLPGFKGYILDIGGPSANMYGFECAKKLQFGACADKRCVFPEICRSLKPDHGPQMEMLAAVAAVPGVKKAFVASGVRYDLVLADRRNGREYLRRLVRSHISGQMKVAPEHSEDDVLRRMGKPGVEPLRRFKRLFDELNREEGRRQFLTYYLIAGYPGCSDLDMQRLRDFAAQELRIRPEEVQIFTPLPSTYSALMYYTGRDPWSGEALFVEKDPSRLERQKATITGGERQAR